MLNINKELLLARLAYLDEINEKTGSDPIASRVSEKVRELIQSGEIISYMSLESVYNYLDEKLRENMDNADQYAREIISFLN